MGPEIKKIGELAYAVIGPEGATNFGIVKGHGGSAILIDADIRRIDEVEEALKLTGCTEVRYLVNTHEHFDHTSANYYFEKKGVPIVASEGCVRTMEEEGEKDFARMMAPEAALRVRFPDLRMTLPQVIFRDSTTLTLPGVTLRLTYCAERGHSHSKGDTTLFLEEEETLLAGDLLYTENHPVAFFGNIPNWLVTLKSLLQSHFSRVVPGHGPAVEGENKGKEYFKKLYDYLEDFYGQVSEAKAGRKSPDEVAKHMLSGVYAALGKTRMVKRNIDQFLTGRWYL